MRAVRSWILSARAWRLIAERQASTSSTSSRALDHRAARQQLAVVVAAVDARDDALDASRDRA